MAGVCKFYQEGSCKYGNSCRFLHTRPNSPGIGRSVGSGRSGVCKFHLEGNCRFGDRCRFQHPSKGGRQDSRGYEKSHYQPPPIDTGRNWNQRGGRNQFDLYSGINDNGGRSEHTDYDQGRVENVRNYGGDRYHYSSPNYRQSRDLQSLRGGGGAGRDQDSSRYHRQSRDWQSSRGGGGAGRDQGSSHYPDHRQSRDWQSSRGGGGADRDQGNNRYHYSSPDRRQSQSSRGGGARYQDYDSQHGVFGGERKELFKEDQDQKSHFPFNDPSDTAALISKDMEESRAMWPLSCYGNSKEIPCVPGLIEVSPEELRLLAYTAISAGTSSDFLQNMEELKRRQSDARQRYMNITPEEVTNLLVMLSQPPVSSSDDWSTGLFGPVATGLNPASVFSSNSAASQSVGDGKSFPLFQDSKPLLQGISKPPLFSPMVQTVSQDQTLQPATPPIRSVSSSTQEQDASTLSQEVLEAFKTQNFTLGKIPEHPPPPELC